MIAENFEWVRSKIEDALQRSGRIAEDVRLIAVSKTVSEMRILEAIEAGAVDFGENKVQEACSKIRAFNHFKVGCHMIGHLQRNKVKYIYDVFDRVHSVDSFGLAEEIHREAKKRGRVMPVLVQVNIARDGKKYGLDPNLLEGVLKDLSYYDGIQIDGLMAMIPYDSNPEKSRVYYAKLRELRDRIAALKIDHIFMKELSMGMTHDFHIAVEEGATMVRVGTAIFEKRPE